MEPNAELHEIADRLLEWLGHAATDENRPVVKVEYWNYTEALLIDDCTIWDSEGNGEIYELLGDRVDDGPVLTFENAVLAYKHYVLGLAVVSGVLADALAKVRE